MRLNISINMTKKIIPMQRKGGKGFEKKFNEARIKAFISFLSLTQMS